MLTLISPAKKLNLDIVTTLLEPSLPRLLAQTKILARAAKKQSAGDLKKLMKLSDNLADLNAQRYKAFNLNGQSNSAKPAALTFDGDVYHGLGAASLDKDSLQFAQSHLRILSGLYGVLKPMDIIQPHRLEMGTKLETGRGKNLYQFWGRSISDALVQDLEGHKDKTIVNLASHEYFKAVDKAVLDTPVITASFLNIKDGQARSLMFYAKRARGLMARWIAQNKIEHMADLKGFDAEGYTIDSGRSDEHNLVFTRKQPPPKKPK